MFKPNTPIAKSSTGQRYTGEHCRTQSTCHKTYPTNKAISTTPHLEHQILGICYPIVGVEMSTAREVVGG